MITHTANPNRAALATLALLSLAALSHAQSDAIFSNARLPDLTDPGLATGTLTTSGVTAPATKRWSELQATGLTAITAANAITGFSVHDDEHGYRLADDFTPTSPWFIDEIVVYAFVTGAGPSNPFTGANFQIWAGQPGAANSSIRFGDETTNRLISATATDMFRVFSTAPVVGATTPIAPTTDRAIWELRLSVSPPLSLRAGTFWLDWQVTTAPGVAAFSPAITVAGQRSRLTGPASNAKQLRLAEPPVLADAWLPVVDPGKPAPAPDLAQDLPFIIRGVALPTPCNAADIANDAGQPINNPAELPDPLVTNNGVTEGDYNAFFAGFFDARSWCDIANDDGSPLPPFGTLATNNGVTEGDYNLFFSIFFDGCSF